MRALLVVVLCSGAMLGQAALADPATPDSSAVPPTAAQSQNSTVPSAPAQPQNSTVPAAPTPAAAAPPVAPAESANVNLDEVVCRQSAPTTGTRFGGGRECHTVRQWRERQAESERILRQQQTVGFQGSGG